MQTSPEHTLPRPYGPTPSARQLAWHELEFYGFLHFTVNTFTDKEWGYGDEEPGAFFPTDFDADEIADVALAAGMQGLILTCKHHDGFCLWPSRYTDHSVANSPWRNGRGDVVRAISTACQARGLRFGVYLSPWDRNHPAYARPEYLSYYRAQLRELLDGYGPIFEVWFDGANGGDGYYGGARERREIDRSTYYRWEETWQLVRDLQPEACIFSDAGPDVRWVGNESGIAGDPCWAALRRAGLVPGLADQQRLNTGDRDGTDWVPAECDVSIRPGWFYHTAEDDRVRSPQNLFDLYLKSVGRGASLLLNLPPDRRGRIHDADRHALRAFSRQLAATFSVDLARRATAVRTFPAHHLPRHGPQCVIDGRRDTCWYVGDGVQTPEMTLTFDQPVSFDVIGLREHLPLGQRIEAFAVDVWDTSGWRTWGEGTSVGSRRLVQGPRETTTAVRLRITQAPVAPAVAAFSLYRRP